MTALKTLALGAALLVLAACEEGGEVTGTFSTPLTRAYDVGGVRWNDGVGGFTYLWDIVDLDGELHVCGAGFADGQQRQRENRLAMRTHSFQVNGQEVYRGTAHFRVYADEDALLEGQMATCRGTGVPTPAGNFSKDVKALRTTIRV